MANGMTEEIWWEMVKGSISVFLAYIGGGEVAAKDVAYSINMKHGPRYNPLCNAMISQNWTIKEMAISFIQHKNPTMWLFLDSMWQDMPDTKLVALYPRMGEFVMLIQQGMGLIYKGDENGKENAD